MKIHRIIWERFDVNSYVLEYSEKAVIIDCNTCTYPYLEKNNIKPDYIFVTHEHFDHIEGLGQIKAKFPEVNITIGGGCDFEGMADIHFDYSPQTAKEACKILREELFKHGDLYIAFLASIESSLMEQKVTALPFQPESDIADKILQRIIGED